MIATKDSIKLWLEQYPERNREWLANQCDVGKRTVDNWLSSPQEIPSKALRIIENLMRSDAAKTAASQPPTLSNVVLRVDVDEFEDWSHAGLKRNQTVTEYCLSAIRAAYQAEQRIEKAPGPHAEQDSSPAHEFLKVAETAGEYRHPAANAPVKYPTGKRNPNKK